MSSVKLLLVVVLGSAACHPVLAQDAQALAGAPDCRFAPIQPAPMDAPRWDGACKGGYADGKAAGGAAAEAGSKDNAGAADLKAADGFAIDWLYDRYARKPRW